MRQDIAESATLQTMRQCRSALVNDFLTRNHEIYLPSYRYEKSPVLLKLARERYFITWLSGHWLTFSHVVAPLPPNERLAAEKVFAHVFLGLMKSYFVLEATDSRQVGLGLAIIENMKKALAAFIATGEKADSIRNELELANEKSRVLFERELQRLEGEVS